MKQLKKTKYFIILAVISLFLCWNYRDVYATDEQSSEYTNLTSNVDAWNVIGHDGATVRQGPSAIFDNLAKTKWCTAVKIGDYVRNVQWAMKEPVTVYEYSFVTANDAKMRDIWTWTFYGYNSMSQEWVVLDTVTESNFPEERGATTDSFVVDNPGEYQYYKFEVTDNRAHLTDLYYQVADLNLYGEKSVSKDNDNKKENKANSYINLFNLIKQSGLKGDEGENGIAAALDNNIETKWCVAINENDSQCSIQWTMSEAAQVDAYAFVTADDLWKLDPKDWTLYGSNSSRGDWKVLSKVDKGELPKDRKTMSEIFTIENPGEYKYYKLTITDNQGHMMKKYQFSEFMLLAEKNADSIYVNGKQTDGAISIGSYIWILLLIAIVIIAIRVTIFWVVKKNRKKESKLENSCNK